MPVEQPQLRITIGGALVPGAMSLQVESLAYFSADRFSVTFAAEGAFNAAYFSGLGTQMVTIDAAFNGGYTNLITGQIDHIRIDVSNNTATLCGRDLSALMIDSEITETFNNQTSSQIALSLAALHGLSANVTATHVPVGQYYQLDHARSALGLHSRISTEWNLLTQLAQIENFGVFVSGTTLNFGPVPAGQPVLLTPQDMMLLELDMATTLPAAATVKSWNTRNKMVMTQTQGGSGGTTMIRPNLTVAQAGMVAANHLSALARHRMTLTATMPGDVTLTPASQILLSGTDSSFDTTYNIDVIARSLNARQGFTQTIRAYALN